MFRNTKAFSSFSVDSIPEAKQFYGEILGMKVSEMPELGLLNFHLENGASIMVYPKPEHQPATFTILNFMVPDIEKAVANLKTRGVTFEHYNMKDLKTDADGISRGEGPLIAWFKDPAGNILSVIQEGTEA